MTTNNQRLVVFTLTYPPYIGGAEVALQQITARLTEYQFDVITARFSPKNPRTETIANVTVYRVGFGAKLDKYLFFILGYFKALKLYRQHGYQLVWAMMANYAGLAALLFKWTFRLNYLLTLQSGDSDSFIWKRTWFWQPLYKQIYRQADRIQAISRWLERRARNYGYKGRVEVVPNGVNVEKFSQEISQEEKLSLLSQLSISAKGAADLPALQGKVLQAGGRRGPASPARSARAGQAGWKSTDKIIITISRLVKKNGVGDLIESLKYLDEQYKLLIIGGGKLEDKLKFKTQELGLSERVIFLGSKSHDELYKYLKISNIFIRPSLTEGFGNVFLEAMAAGVPVIATAVGGIKDFLVDGETGLVCEVNNPQSIAEQVKKLEKTQDLRAKIVGQCQEMLNNYSWEVISLKIGKIIKELCA